jgi:hypothetical protein
VSGVGGPPRAAPEKEMLRRVAANLEGLGYRVYVDPDGTDYFDLVARRSDEVGLVEGKIRDGRAVLRQALERRAWGDWVGVALASRRAAESLARRTEGTRAAPVGVWAVEGSVVTVVRPSRRWPEAEAGEDPFAPLRARFRRLLEAIDRGELPPGVPWSDVVREARRASGGRGFAEWRLDETGPE